MQTSPSGAVPRPVSRRLYLLRHAKSRGKHSPMADHERPLAGRGRRAADAIARHVEAHGIAVELVLCSTARRARETLERIEPALATVTVRYEPEIYGASAGALLERLRQVPDEIAAVMVVGHNPAIERLAQELARPSPERRDLAAKFPTGALATLELSLASWRDIDLGSAALVDVVRPRELEA